MAMAGGFTEGRVALWRAQGQRFVQAFRDDRRGVKTQETLRQACDGLCDEMFPYGMYRRRRLTAPRTRSGGCATASMRATARRTGA
jgi:hypothetical protein